MNKGERFLAALVLGVAVFAGGEKIDRNHQSASPKSEGDVLKVTFLPDVQPSQRALKEQVINTGDELNQIFALMEKIDEAKMRDAVSRLKELYNQGILHLSSPGEGRRLPTVEPVGGWPDARSSSFQIWASQDFLASSEFSKADKAIFIYQALKVYQQVADLRMGDRDQFLQTRSQIEDQAWRQTIADTHRSFANLGVSPVLSLAFSQWAAASKNSPEFPGGSK